MRSTVIRYFSTLVDFLGKVLGPDYEIALHEIDSDSQSIIAIANGNVSGRKVGAPITDLALKMIKDKVYEKRDYVLNYKGISKTGKVLRSSTIFIKEDDGTLVGMLCINFDGSRYADVSRQVLELCHPSILEDEVRQPIVPPSSLTDAVENFPETISEAMDTVMSDCLQSSDASPDRLTQAEKIHIVEVLNQRGIFLLKGAVSQVAKQLCCSEPTVYRYLSMVNNDK